MDTALDESMDSITHEAPNENVGFANSFDPEKLKTTRELSFGGKIEVHLPLDSNLYFGSVSEYSEGIIKHRISCDVGQIDDLNMSRILIPEIASILNKVIRKYFETFKHKEFMLR